MNVIVVGAGMAGIMAARTLHDAGRDVTLIEARSRIGGRTYTDHSMGATVDLGAAWIHGPDGNPLLPLAKQLEIDFAETDFINRSGDVVLAYDADGTPLEMSDYTNGQMLANGAFVHAGGSELHNTTPFKAESLEQFLHSELPRPAGMNETEAKGFYYWSTVLSEYLQASDQNLIASPMSGPGWHLPGIDLLLYGGGYNTITDYLARGLNIKTGVAVKHINYGGERIILHTNQGDFEADQIIVTVPLGVLKEGRISFEPPLPPSKQAAIKRIGFGWYEKLVLQFDKFYWPRDKQRFNYLSEGDPPLFNVWLNIGYYDDNPIIVAYHAGRRAHKINEWDDATLLANARATMQRLFGDNGYGTVPEPTNYTRTNWQNDPFSCGSYSFRQVGQQADDRRALAATVAGKLYFAGEATHSAYWATVHGAYETGIRAANELLGDS